MTKRIFLCGIFLLSAMVAQGAEKTFFTQEESNALAQELFSKLLSFEEYYSPVTHVWYAAPVSKLHTLEQIRELNPNPVSYGTGFADCALCMGTVLVGYVQWYEATGDETIRPLAYDAYVGLRMLGSAHGVRGYVTRGLSAEDGKSTYITSSRDQYTHYVEGLWEYYRSPLCSETSRREIRLLLSELADAAREQVVPENDYSFLRADGTKDPRGLHKMWLVYAHEAARLPMIYAAAWDVTGEKKYFDWYREFCEPSIVESLGLRDKPLPEVQAWVPTYSFYQMQCSLSLMYQVEPDEGMKAKILEAMEYAKDFANVRYDGVRRNNNLAEYAEISIAQMILPQFALSPEQQTFVEEMFRKENRLHTGVWGITHQIRALTHACLSGYLPKPTVAVGKTTEVKEIPMGELVWKPVPARKVVDEHQVIFVADAHVTKEKPENLAKFQEVCQMILALRPRPSAVVLVGDCVDSRDDRESYQAVRKALEPLMAVGIPLRFCLGENDSRTTFFEVFPEYSPEQSLVAGKWVNRLEMPRADFLLLDTSEEGLGKTQEEWLNATLETYRPSGKPVFVVSHKSLADLQWGGGETLPPSFMAWIHGDAHRWGDRSKDVPRTLSLQSTAYSADGADHQGFCYLQLDRYEFICRPVTFDPSMVWSRRAAIFRLTEAMKKF
ncbi:MAG: metallophosphoesterase [Planctomycetia bacterium]|nr:metallophosphoesterase [Planctomycetia bacterium]